MATTHNNDIEPLQFPFFQRLMMNSVCLLLGDAFVLVGSLVLAGFLRYYLRDSMIPPSRGFLLVPVWCLGVIFFRLIPGWGLGAVEELRRTQILLLAMFGMASVALFLSKSADVTSRFKYLLMYLLCVPMIPLARVAIKRALIQAGTWGVPAVVYGLPGYVETVVSNIKQEEGMGYIPYGVFTRYKDAKNDVGDVPILGEMKDTTPKAPVAVLAAAGLSPSVLTHMIEGPLSHYRRVIIIPDVQNIPSLWVQSRDFMGMLGLELVRNLTNPLVRWLKEGFEIFVVLLTAPVWVFLCLLMAFLVWLHDRSFPFYAQDRVGQHGKMFRTWKLRTMIPDADMVLKQRIKENPELSDEWSRSFKMRNDPRITPIGRFLRKSSLDELPQLINVLKGEMSLVGPRPLPLYHHQHIPEQVRVLREQVLPGITGLWQVSGRSSTGTAGMERWDAYYVRNWSIWLDVVILVRTLRAVCRAEGAY